MADLRDDFRHWLIKQGLSEKTKTGRAGTVYEYIRRIDNLCNKIYKDHSIQGWQKLAENIYPVLGLHLLCRKGEIHITKDQFAKVDTFIKKFNSQLNQYKENFKDYFTVKFVFDKDIIFVDYVNFVERLIEKTPPKITIFKISDSIIQINKNRNALEKFYQFLLYNNASNCFSGSVETIDKNINISKEFNSLKTEFAKLKSFQNRQSDIFRVIIKAGTRTTPPQLTLGKSDTNENIANGIGEAEVLKILRITRQTLKSLVDAGIFHKNANKLFDMNEINQHILKNFTSSAINEKTPSGQEITTWWTVKEAKKKTGLGERRIERLRENKRVSYIKVSKGKYLFYPPDFTIYSKIKPLTY